jgi:hypothetical protein
MKTETLSLFINPFRKIAGFQAFGLGFAGYIVATLLSVISGYHYHGLLHYGSAPNPAWWCFAIEHLTVWLIPAALFYAGGLLFAKSRIRFIDVFGTTLFAQAPFVLMNLFALLPSVRKVTQIDPGLPLDQILIQPGFMTGISILMISIVFMVLALIWMFQALRVSCNLKGGLLITIYIISIFGGDFLCRIIIGLLY